MSFITGLILIDAPASALNNSNQPIEGTLMENSSSVKYIRTRQGAYPYVSAQAFRFWLRRTLEQGDLEWKAAPIYREKKVAYTDANPIKYWDDDLFGYMRAPSKKESAVEARKKDKSRSAETPTEETVTRVSPLRVSTFVSLTPVTLVNDFGVMARHPEGDPVPYEHQFYRTTLQGLLSLDLKAAGTFSFRDKTGYLNLDAVRVKEAQEEGLEELEEEKAYRLPTDRRLERINSLLGALAQLNGGAKLAQHYTDVSPDLLILAVTQGGNNIFGHVIGADSQGQPAFKTEAFQEIIKVTNKQILSKIYIGWVKGYLDEMRSRVEAALQENGILSNWSEKIVIGHPIVITQQLIQELKANPDWLD